MPRSTIKRNSPLTMATGIAAVMTAANAAVNHLGAAPSAIRITPRIMVTATADALLWRTEDRSRDVATVMTRANPSRAMTNACDQSAFGVAIAHTTAKSASTSTAM